MFRVAAGTEMTPELLAEYMTKHKTEINNRYQRLHDAYENKYEISRLAKKPDWKPDNRIPVNFAKYITDTMNGFFIGIPIKTISEKANDVDYFADAYLKILGAKLEKDELEQLRQKRIINFDGEDASSLIVEFLQKPDGDTTQENLINRLEKLIFQICMVANISDENFGASSGIALKYKLQCALARWGSRLHQNAPQTGVIGIGGHLAPELGSLQTSSLPAQCWLIGSKAELWNLAGRTTETEWRECWTETETKSSGWIMKVYMRAVNMSAKAMNMADQ